MQETPAPTPIAQGQKVVFLYTLAPNRMAVDAMKDIQGHGGQIVLVGPQVRHYEKAYFQADHYVRLIRRASPVKVDPSQRPAKFTPAWAAIVATNLTRKATYKPLGKVLGQATMWWLAARQNPDALAELDGADVITAVDPGAVYMAWEASRRNTKAHVINGIGPTLEHLGLVR